MAATTAVSGFGTLLKLKSGTSTTTIAEVQSVTGPGLSRDTYDVTHMESPSGYREFVGGLVDGGEVSIDLNFLPPNSTQTTLRGLITSTAQTWNLVFPDASTTTWTMVAFVTAFEPTAPHDDAMSASATLKLTGPVTFS